MPKLNKATAKAVDETEVQSFAPVPPGLYAGRLRSVTQKEGPKGPYWSWEFEVPEDYEFSGRRFWNSTSLSEAARFKVKESFAAFGVAADTDTDELCGKIVTLRVGVRTIQQGEKAGQVANTVEEVLPFVEGEGGDAEEPF